MTNEQIDALHVALLEIMDEIDRICRVNDIDYFLDSGSALGAIRHHGFIPWDDDIDVGMTRENYEIFLKVSEEELNPNFFLQTIETDKGYNKLHAKIRKNNTVFMEHKTENKDMHHGVFIDIFPFDRIPIKFSKSILWLNESYQRTYHRKVDEGYTRSIFKSLLSKILIGRHPQRSFDRLCKIFAWRNDRGVVSYNYFFEEHYIFPKRIFEGIFDVDFEGRKYKLMTGYDEYLRIMYGDYMQLPPVEKRITHDIAVLEL